LYEARSELSPERIWSSFSHQGVASQEVGGMVMDHLELLATEQSGQTMAEYAVVMTVITIAIVATLALVSSTVTGLINTVIPLI
jgi:Flp pilus assembly pilin Flp